MNRIYTAMRRSAFAFVLLCSFATSAADRIVFQCQGPRAVGYVGGSQTPNVFTDSLPIRIVEYETDKGDWTLETPHVQGGWTGIGSESSASSERAGWFIPGSGVAGSYFVLNLKNMRYTYLATTAYLVDNVGAISMQIGTCRRVNLPLGR